MYKYRANEVDELTIYSALPTFQRSRQTSLVGSGTHGQEIAKRVDVRCMYSTFQDTMTAYGFKG